MTTERMQLFISYSRADSAFVDRLQADLERNGYSAWVDRRRLEGGQIWEAELENAINRAQAILVILSPEANASPNVQAEYSYALKRKKPLIPILYRSANVPMRLDIFQYVDFTSLPYEQAFRQLHNALQALRFTKGSAFEPPKMQAGSSPLPQSPPLAANQGGPRVGVSKPAQNEGCLVALRPIMIVFVVIALLLILPISVAIEYQKNPMAFPAGTPIVVQCVEAFGAQFLLYTGAFFVGAVLANLGALLGALVGICIGAPQNRPVQGRNVGARLGAALFFVAPFGACLGAMIGIFIVSITSNVNLSNLSRQGDLLSQITVEMILGAVVACVWVLYRQSTQQMWVIWRKTIQRMDGR